MSPHLKRLNKLQQFLTEWNIDTLLVEHPIDLYYLTGMDLSCGTIIITENKAQLIVDGRYIEMCQKQSPISAILPDKNLLQNILDLTSTPLPIIGFDSETIPYQRYLELQKIIGRPLTPIEGPVKQLRQIKDALEINLLREAAQLGAKGFDLICSFLSSGISESEIGIELEIFWKKQGGKKTAFDPIIAFGPNSSIPHHRAGNARLKKGQPVLIDIGVTKEHYNSDMTRVIFFGTPDPKMKEIYQIVQEAQQAAIDACQAGVPIGSLDAIARDIISRAGYGNNFTHSLGHGVGLEIHEAPGIRNKPPYSQKSLEPGMVITIEPGIYLPGLGGVRIEDTLVITNSGYENLTNRTTEMLVYK